MFPKFVQVGLHLGTYIWWREPYIWDVNLVSYLETYLQEGILTGFCGIGYGDIQISDF